MFLEYFWGTSSGKMTPKPATKNPTALRLPQAMIARFHNFLDHQKVMEAARCKKEVLFEGTKMFFFQDFAVETL